MKKILLIVALGIFCSLPGFAEAKYVFYFIGDGMGMGHVNATQTYLRQKGYGEDALLMTTFPVASQSATFSASAPITDSAAAGTALSTGSKTNNNVIGIDASGDTIYSIAADFLAHGFAVGVASSVAADDATPAAFYGHVADRRQWRTLANQAAESDYHFFGGPLFRGMRDSQGSRDAWVATMQEAGYSIFDGFSHYRLRPRSEEKMVLLSTNPQGDQIGYAIDSIPDALTLQQITLAGLNQLRQSSARNGDKGFFFMVEGGNIDWASHANDGGAVIKEIINFQEAIDVAYQFYLQHPEETLIVITADHDTGGMAMGRYDNERNIRLTLADYQKISKDRFSDYCKAMLRNGDNMTWPEMRQFLNENLGFFGPIEISEEEEDELHRYFDVTFIEREGKDVDSLYNSFNEFAVKVYNVLNKKMGISWTTGYHTGNLVPVYAIGEGSELFTSQLDNTQIPLRILQAAGIER